MTTTIRSSADGSKSHIAVGGTDRVTIDAATGAVGIGVTPSATWASVQSVLELGSNTAAFTTSAGDNMLGSNLIYDGALKYRATGMASRIAQIGGSVYLTSYSSANAGDAAGGVTTFLVSTDGNSLHVTPNGGLGYGPGAGGTVTQATNKSTAVTLNKPTGIITTAGGVISSGTEIQFVLNNNLLTSNDKVVVSQVGLSINTTYYALRADATGPGQAVISIKNLTGSNQNHNIPIQFSILKGAQA